MAKIPDDTAARVLEVHQHLAERFDADVVQEVVITVLDAEKRGDQIDLPKAEELARQCATRFRRATNGVRSAEEAQIQDGETPKPVRRKPSRAPAFPRGALPIRFGETPNETTTPHHVGVIASEVADPPSPEVIRALGEIIHFLLVPAVQGLPAPPEQHAATLECYEQLFGHRVEQGWIRWYLPLIEEAKRRQLEQRANAAVRSKDAHAATSAEGERRMGPEQVLEHVRRILELAPATCRMPAYADDAELVAWLIARMGFEGGGGPAAMTSRRLKELILDPDALANAIDEFAARVVEHLPDHVSRTAVDEEPLETEAAWGKDRLAKLAARVRERGALVPSPSEVDAEHKRPPKYEPRTRNDAPPKRGEGDG